jgi:predicted AAA+ superfamily ATPase
MWIPRLIEGNWTQAGRQPVKVVTGLRQCGKSSLLERLGGSDYRFVSLDDLQNRNLAQSDPGLFFATNSGNLIIDEVHHSPQLFSEIKRLVDAQKAGKIAPRSFWLSGSNQILFRKGIEESLAGRASPIRLHPLSVSEVHSAMPDFPLVQLLLYGGWPELISQGYSLPESVRYLNEYLQLVLEKDVAQSAGITKVSQFLKVVGLLAGRAANVLEMASLGAAAGVQASTISDWVGALEQMLIIYRLPSFHTDLTKRVIKAPKLYFYDCGMLSRLQGWQVLEPLLTSPMVGATFENLAFSEILRTRDHALKDWQLSYYRTKDGDEIDFVISSGQSRLLLECKFAAQKVSYQPMSLPAKKVFGDLPIHLVTFGGDFRPLGHGSYQIPIWALKDFLLEHLS